MESVLFNKLVCMPIHKESNTHVKYYTNDKLQEMHHCTSCKRKAPNEKME